MWQTGTLWQVGNEMESEREGWGVTNRCENKTQRSGSRGRGCVSVCYTERKHTSGTEEIALRFKEIEAGGFIQLKTNKLYWKYYRAQSEDSDSVYLKYRPKHWPSLQSGEVKRLRWSSWHLIEVKTKYLTGVDKCSWIRHTCRVFW